MFSDRVRLGEYMSVGMYICMSICELKERERERRERESM